jgi:hypothetical protein
MVGSTSEGGLFFDVGVEQWENGKKAAFRHQIWAFRCSVRRALPTTPNCTVERLVIDDWGQFSGVLVRMHTHQPSENNIRINRLDWDIGVLDITLQFYDGETAEVSVRFERKGNLYYLRSFKGVSVHRSGVGDDLSTIEYRIPKYTYTLNVPLEMKGLSDAGLEKWDALFESLIEADKNAWKRLQANARSASAEAWMRIVRQKMKQRFPGIDIDAVDKGTRELSKEEKAAMDSMVKETFEYYLVSQIERSSLSPQAKKRIGAHIRSGLSGLR